MEILAKVKLILRLPLFVLSATSQRLCISLVKRPTKAEKEGKQVLVLYGQKIFCPSCARGRRGNPTLGG
jgi:hypothetical protein